MSVKGIRSSLSEADGSKADSLLTFWTRLSALIVHNAKQKSHYNSPYV